MTREERDWLHERIREHHERERRAREAAEAALKHCSRCPEVLTCENRSPGRAWCRRCENKRRKRCYHAARAMSA